MTSPPRQFGPGGEEAIAGAADAGGRAYRPGRVMTVAKIVDALLDRYRFLCDPQGQLYLYAEGYWRPLFDHEVKAAIFQVEPRASRSRRNDACDELKARTATFGAGAIPWGRVADHEIPCRNGVLDVRTMRLRPHAPENRLERVLPVAWDPAAECPTWHQCLIDWFGEDDAGGCAEGLQAFFGYVVLAHAKWKKALVIKGESDSGKTAVLNTAKALVGQEFTCSLSVRDMADAGARSMIKGKALNLVFELPTDSLIADGGFKTLVSTEEPIYLDEKYRAREMYVPTAKHIIATNVLPRINDFTSATMNRLLLIPMERTIPKNRQDRRLEEKLRAELPGILLWSAEGARRLVDAKGQWPEVAAATALLEEYRRENNPVDAFLAEWTEADPNRLEQVQSLCSHFLTSPWGRGGRVREVKAFSRLAKSAGYTITKARVTDLTGNKKPVSCMVGRRYVGPPRGEMVVSSIHEAADGSTVVEGEMVRDQAAWRGGYSEEL